MSQREAVQFNIKVKPIMLEALTKAESTGDDLRDQLISTLTERLRVLVKLLSTCLERTNDPGVPMNLLLAAYEEQCHLIRKHRAKKGNKYFCFLFWHLMFSD